MFDTHCHLTDKKVAHEFEEIVKEAVEAGVLKMIMPSVDLADAQNVIARVDGKNVYGLVGIHPENVESTSDLEESQAKIRELCEKVGIVGIGECGLDFYWDREKKTKQKQIELLKMQIELALELDLPIVLHNRESATEMIEVLTPYKGLKAQLHCFDGGEELLEFGLERGFYFSFCGNLTYKNNEHLVKSLLNVPLDRLLLETDTPYLSPLEKRGQVNRPINVKMIAEFIALKLGKSTEEVVLASNQNAVRLFEKLS